MLTLYFWFIAALAALFIGWLVGAISRPALPAAAPFALSALPALESAGPGICWHPGVRRNASIAIEAGCE